MQNTQYQQYPQNTQYSQNQQHPQNQQRGLLKSLPIGLILCGLGVVSFIFALCGSKDIGEWSCYILCGLSVIYLVYLMIPAIKARQKGQIILYATRILAVVMIFMGIWGITYVHAAANSLNTSVSELMEYLSLLVSIGLDGNSSTAQYADASDYAKLNQIKAGLFFMQNRVWLLIIGLIILVGPYLWNLYVKYSGNGAVANQRASAQAQQLVQSAQRGLQTMNRSLHAAKQQFHAVQQYAQQAVQQPGGMIREDRCCICGGRFRNGYATLFTLPDGREARIDEECWGRINTVYSGTDPMQITQINSWFYSRLPMVDSTVAPYIQSYIQTGNQRLAQGQQGQTYQQ